MIPVEFEQPGYVVNERAGYIEICLLSSGQNNADIFVDVQPQETIPASARGIYVCTFFSKMYGSVFMCFKGGLILC